MRQSRRAVLRLSLVAASIVGAGCTSSNTTGTPPPTATETERPRETPTESATPTPVETPIGSGQAGPAPSCGDYEPIDPGWVVAGRGPLGGFDLTLNRRELVRGDTLTPSLTNVTDAEQSTGNRKKYDIQFRGAEGWHSIFGTDGIAPWTDEAVGHQPGEGFTWELTVTQDGLTEAVDHGPAYYVCSPLEPGTYRFVFWGITTERERREDFETDYALGVPFTVSGD